METLKFLMISTHYPPSHIGGDAVHVQILSRELSRMGHEVHVLTSPSVYRILRGGAASEISEHTDIEPTVHAYKPRFARTAMGRTYALGFAGGAGKMFDDVSKRIRADVVHWHNTKAFFARMPKSAASESLYTAHDYFSICPRANLTRPEGTWCSHPQWCQLCLVRSKRVPQLWRIGSRRTSVVPGGTRILCPSEFVAARLREQGLSVSDVLPPLAPAPQSTTNARGLSERSVTYVGVLERHKGGARLLDAFLQSEGEQGFRLTIIGKGSMKDEIAHKVRAHGMEQRVRIAGFLPRADVDRIVQESDAVIVPSEWPENAPLVAIEALSHGVPVIGSDAGGIPEITALDPDSMLFKAGSTDGLAQSLRIAWDRGNDHIGLSSRRAYEDHFSPRAHLSRYMDIIARGCH